MIKIRKSKDRGLSQHDWLHSLHTFSFAEYYDPAYMGFNTLRVINEDTVQSGMGFGTHSHHDMEIISYVVEGVMEHKDSMGTGSLIKPGEIQRMSAGTGVRHSEFNHSKDKLLHFLQIWIIPNRVSLNPSYEQISIPKTHNQLILIGSEQGGEHAITIHQDVNLFAGYFSKGKQTDYPINSHRQLWVQLIKGQILLNNQLMEAGDGAAVVDESSVTIQCIEEAEFLLFDLRS